MNHRSVKCVRNEHTAIMDSKRLERALTAEFDPNADELRVVVRQACDLADSGKIARDRGHELTVEDIVANLRDAPKHSSLSQRWNWWLGALETAYGGYAEFRILPTLFGDI